VIVYKLTFLHIFSASINERAFSCHMETSMKPPNIEGNEGVTSINQHQNYIDGYSGYNSVDNLLANMGRKFLMPP